MTIQSEKKLLSMMMMDTLFCRQVLPLFSSKDFRLDNHATIFNSIYRLISKNKYADFLTITEELKEQGLFDSVGVEYICEILEIDEPKLS